MQHQNAERFRLIDAIISVIFKAISLAPSLVKFWDAIQLSGSEPQQTCVRSSWYSLHLTNK